MKALQLCLLAALAVGSAQASLITETFEGATDGFSNTVGNIPGTGLDLVSGSYDIKGPTYYPWICTGPASGTCLDTLGGGGANGVFTTAALNFLPGNYQLSFALVRWNDTQLGGGPQDATVRFEIAGLFSEDFVVDGSFSDQVIVRQFFVAAPTSTPLVISNLSSSVTYAGAVIDNLDVSDIPEPSSFALMGLGLAGAAFLRRRFAR